MFSHASLLYLFVETPLHAGSGRGVGSVDLPIQRERVTGYPLLQASGIKGKLRVEAKATYPDDGAKVEAVFGPATISGSASGYAGALSPGDARLLLLPVRSLAGVFAWTTSANALHRFRRDASAAGLAGLDWTLTVPPAGTALVAPNSEAVSGERIVLEEFSYTPTPEPAIQTMGEWLATHCLPDGPEYDYWRRKLPRSLVVLPEDDFRDFALYATEVVTRVRLDNNTKTVESGALWTEESLPVDTLLYSPLYASGARNGVADLNSGQAVLDFVRGLKLARVQLGGDETVGRGLVALRFGEVHHV